MKKAFIKWMSKQKWIYKLSVKLIANRIVHSENRLTKKYLTDKGWIEKDGFLVEPNIKESDKIFVIIEKHYFRVWHGKEKTFIALESTVEWFENYYLLVHGRTERYELAGF